MSISNDLMCDFNLMYEKAQSLIKHQSNTRQILVLKLDNGEICAFENDISKGTDIEDEIIEKLIKANQTHIKSILCMWDIGGIDVPSYHFRTRIRDLDVANIHTEVFLQSITHKKICNLEPAKN